MIRSVGRLYYSAVVVYDKKLAYLINLMVVSRDGQDPTLPLGVFFVSG